MKIGTYDFGDKRVINVIRNQPMSNNTVRMSLKNIPTRIDGKRVNILDFVLRTPTPTLTVGIADDSGIDAQFMAQRFKLITLVGATNAPFAAFNGDPRIIAGVDGVRALNALSWRTGRKMHNDPRQDMLITKPIAATGVSYLGGSTLATGVASVMGTSESGWLQFQGPVFYNNSGAAADIVVTSYRDVWPIGRKFGEPDSRYAIPAPWFTGNACKNDCQGNPGYLEIELNTTIDNLAVTWGTDGWDLDVICELTPDDQVNVPGVPFIRVGVEQGKFALTPGIMQLFTFATSCPTTGIMPARAYTTVRMTSDGRELADQTVNIARALNQLHAGKNFPVSDGALDDISSYTTVTRRSSFGNIMLLHRGSPLEAPGDLDIPTMVDILSATPTSHDFLQMNEIPGGDARVLKAALAMEENTRYVPWQSTRNGRQLKNDGARAMPHKLVIL